MRPWAPSGPVAPSCLGGSSIKEPGTWWDSQSSARCDRSPTQLSEAGTDRTFRRNFWLPLPGMACCFGSSSGVHDPEDFHPEPIDETGRVRRSARLVFLPLSLPPACLSLSSLTCTPLLSPHFWQVDELRQRLSGIIPPVDVQWGAEATVNTSGLAGSVPGGAVRPTTSLGSFERRQSVNLRHRAGGAASGSSALDVCRHGSFS